MLKKKDVGPWGKYKSYLVDFSPAYPGELFSEPRSWAVLGEPGVGKSAFLLWALDRAFDRRARLKPWFNKAVFLSPKAHERWLQKLVLYDPNETLVAIDSVFRVDDSQQVKENKAVLVANILGGFVVGPQETDPFQVILTLRKDEFDFLL